MIFGLAFTFDFLVTRKGSIRLKIYRFDNKTSYFKLISMKLYDYKQMYQQLYSTKEHSLFEMTNV